MTRAVLLQNFSWFDGTPWHLILEVGDNHEVLWLSCHGLQLRPSASFAFISFFHVSLSCTAPDWRLVVSVAPLSVGSVPWLAVRLCSVSRLSVLACSCIGPSSFGSSCLSVGLWLGFARRLSVSRRSSLGCHCVGPWAFLPPLT
jgi:hypothetical protein